MKRVAVLEGGFSSEREVSLRTGAAVAASLRTLGHAVIEIDADRSFVGPLQEVGADVVFNALHGRWGEDGCVQGVLEVLGLPYTGSGVLASALAMDKVLAKRMFVSAGLPVPDGIDAPAAELAGRPLSAWDLEPPVVVKPRNEGSSVGVSIVREEADFAAAVERAAAYDPHLLVERYVAGREINVGILDDRLLGTIEIVPGKEFYDYEAKYERNDTQYLFPARLPSEVAERTCEVARRAHALLGCRGVTRTDLIVTAAGEPYLLEVNTLPGMTATSLIPKIARGIGMSFAELCDALLAGARLGP